MNAHLFGDIQCRCNYIKELEVRTSWIIWLFPKSSNQYPIRYTQDRDTEREGKHTEEEAI